VQRIADDYAVNLPESWLMEVIFDARIPAGSVKSNKLDAAFFIKTSKNFIKQTASAYLRALSGETEQKEYNITSAAIK
jgi:hypothetical protein